MDKANILVFVGTFSEDLTLGTGEVLHGKGEGIYILRMNPITGELKLINKAIAEPNPTYIILDRTKKYLYSTNELEEYKGLKSGAVSAFTINPDSGKLSLLNRCATIGTDPTHLIVNDENTHLLVANYMSGSVCLFPIASNGSLGTVSCFLQHNGKSINSVRQTGPHAHAIELDKNNKRAFVPDLGCDKIFIYNTDFNNGHLSVSNPAYIETKAGEGPRHCVFHPSGKYFYVINEMSSSIYSYLYDESKGNLKLFQIISTLPNGFAGNSTGAAIKILPGGNFLYASNRGDDSVATYKISNNSGELALVSIQSIGGANPRDFDFDPKGNYLLVANQDSDEIVVFKVNRETGIINEASRLHDIFTPTCVKVYSMD